jgi:hypothetical protein
MARLKHGLQNLEQRSQWVGRALFDVEPELQFFPVVPLVPHLKVITQQV